MVMHLGEPLPQDRPTFHFDFAVLSMFFMLTYAGMIWTNGAGASTGMFVPALAVGAAGGRIAGRLVTMGVRCVCVHGQEGVEGGQTQG